MWSLLAHRNQDGDCCNAKVETKIVANKPMIEVRVGSYLVNGCFGGYGSIVHKTQDLLTLLSFSQKQRSFLLNRASHASACVYVKSIFCFYQDTNFSTSPKQKIVCNIWQHRGMETQLLLTENPLIRPFVHPSGHPAANDYISHSDATGQTN